jgi:hypothetical protein
LLPRDFRARELVVELVRGSDVTPALGSIVDAEVRLRNDDKTSIQIPWSVDPKVQVSKQNADNRELEMGTFGFSLMHQGEKRIYLTSMTGWLYGSDFSEGSPLTLRPGESVTARVRFKVEEGESTGRGKLKEGEWELSAAWVQKTVLRKFRDCGIWELLRPYTAYDQDQNPAVKIQVRAAPTTAVVNSAAARGTPQ